MRTVAAVLGWSLVLATSCGPRALDTAPSTPAVVSRNAAPKLRIPPKLRILGIAQDAGVPQAACTSPNCEAARRWPARRHTAASIALVLPDGAVWLVDATPNLPEQLDHAIALGREHGGLPTTKKPVAGVMLTHAHMGHYLGLAHFGFEAAHTDAIPVLATPSMAAFLRDNAPWDQLVRLHNIELREITAGEPLTLGPVRVVPIAVPHRAEYTDTVAYRFEGPHATVLYVPDVDPWARQTDPLALFEGVDVALVDGTFASMDELPGRDQAEIGHPTIASTIALLGDRVGRRELEVVFIHLNHSNPLLDPAARGALPAGFTIAEVGLDVRL